MGKAAIGHSVKEEMVVTWVSEHWMGVAEHFEKLVRRLVAMAKTRRIFRMAEMSCSSGWQKTTLLSAYIRSLIIADQSDSPDRHAFREAFRESKSVFTKILVMR